MSESRTYGGLRGLRELHGWPEADASGYIETLAEGTHMNYSTLAAEISLPQYDGMTDAEIAGALNTPGAAARRGRC